MEFLLVNNDKLKVSLTKEDLIKLEIDYKSIDYSNNNTREMLVEILEKGCIETEFNPRNNKLYIEVFPAQDDGCVIYYTRLQGMELFGRSTFASRPVPVIFSFECAETVIEACACAKSRCAHRILCSSLYLYKKQYRLIIWPLDYLDNLSIIFFSEYGKILGAGDVLTAYIGEHGRLIIQENAIEKLSELKS